MIHLLSEHTINQIAAGEVIENPTSVIKELIENSIDSGACHITVEIKGGGFQLIRIIDDGCGMNKEDALLCLERHATSKIRDVEDLEQLMTMGFRGEALASIAAISRLTLTTAQKDQVGTKVEVEGGKRLLVEVAPRTQGTTIEVRSLFFNVPARKKFQKSASVSSADITRLITHFSLAHPNVSFELIGQDRPIMKAPALLEADFLKNLERRMESVLGADFIQDSYSVSVQDGFFDVVGFIGSPLNTRPSRTGQYLFINKRQVYCPAISYAVRDGYGTRIDEKRHPLYVLHLNIRPDLIDVNVHPQKKEVRLRDEGLFRQKIQDAVRSSLLKVAPIDWKKEENIPFAITAHPFFSEHLPVQESPPYELFIKEKTPPLNEPSFPIFQEPRAIGMYSNYLLLEAQSVHDRVHMFNEKEGSDGILFIDLEAAYLRQCFEKLLKNSQSLLKQGLLIPLTLELSISESSQVKAHLKEIDEAGISIRPFGERTFIVDAILPSLREDAVKEAVLKMAEKLSNGADRLQLQEERIKELALITCQYLRPYKKNFMLQEALGLFEELMRSSCPYLCPYGKPTMVHVKDYEINQYFQKKK